jgi:hypothetical protein
VKVARRSPAQRQLKLQLDELEQKMHQLKVLYNKYFMGFDAVEPVRERDEIKRRVRDIIQKRVTNNTLRFKFQQLRARSVSLDTWITRNMVQIERGTHPKMKFRTNLAERRRAESGANRGLANVRFDQEKKEDQALKKVFDAYVSARGKVGQSTDIPYEKVRETLRKQVREVKSRYRCQAVKFKVTVEDGKVKLKAIPRR